MQEYNIDNLVGQLLIRAPNTATADRQANDVIIIAHTNNYGVIGFNISRPLFNMSLSDLYHHMNIESKINSDIIALSDGGATDAKRGFVLHEAGTIYSGTRTITDELSLTLNHDILYNIACGLCPAYYWITIGCTSWCLDELWQEIQQSQWLIAPCDYKLLFASPQKLLWQHALDLAGYDTMSRITLTNHGVH